LKISPNRHRIATAVYRKIQSKEEIFCAVLEDLSKHSIGPRNTLSQSREADGKKLMSVYEALLLDPWRS